MSKDLDSLLKRLIKLHPKYIDLSLKRVLRLLNKIGNPHLKLPPTIHIAGTNGKGSTLAFIVNILVENNFKVHSYISPHLEKFNERVIVNNKIIKTDELLSVLKYVKKINSNDPITFFEITTAAAFYIFSKKNADFLVIETGLGGKLDATNVVKETLINIITPISIDHQEFLGKNILKITNEKLGIIKKKSNIIIGKQKKIVQSHITNILKKNHKNKKIYNKNFKVEKINKKTFILKYNKKNFKFNNPNLNGAHQIENASTAITAIFTLKEMGYLFKKNKINQGILNTKWPGRLEKFILNKTNIYLDGAHNVDGAYKILKFFSDKKIKVWLILGMLNNKNLYDFLKILKPIIIGVIATEIPNEKNTYSTKEISNICNDLDIKNIEKKEANKINNFVLKKIKPKNLLITGSLYLIGKLRKKYL